MCSFLKKNVMRGMGNFLAAATLGMLTVHSAYAAPAKGSVVRGEAIIDQANPANTVINQASERVVIQWESFNVGATESVQFVQPDSNAAALNRILDHNPSEILGSISANGRVLLVNPNGIVFGNNASVNVGSLVASGLDIDPDAFMNGDWIFRNTDGSTGGVVVNHGLLDAAHDISLFGGAVENNGSIVVAEFGRVNLGAGEQATLDFDGDGLIQFAVDGEVLENLEARTAAVSNLGTINAPNGQVLLNAVTANDVFARVVNNEGVIAASDVVNDDGRVFLVGAGGDVINAGDISAHHIALDASGAITNQGALESDSLELIARGGAISISVADINVTGTADLQAAGDVLLDSDVSAGRIDVSSSGSVQGSGLLTADVLQITAAQGVGSSGNELHSAVDELVIDAGDGAYVREADDVILSGIEVTAGDFSLVTSGNVSQTSAIDVQAGASHLQANDLTLSNAGNNFGESLSVTARNVIVASNGALAFDESDISGTLTATAGGSISDIGVMQVAGDAVFDAGDNAITLDGADDVYSDFAAVGVVSASDVTLRDVNGIRLGHATQGINADSLDVVANGAISNGGAITVANAQIAGADVSLDAANDFDVLSASGGNISVNDVDDLLISATADNVSITAGDVQADLVDASGDVSITATGFIRGDGLATTNVRGSSIALDAADDVSALGLETTAVTIVAGGGIDAANRSATAVTAGSISSGGEVSFIQDGADISFTNLQANGPIQLSGTGLITTGTVSSTSGGLALDAAQVDLAGPVTVNGLLDVEATGGVAMDSEIEATQVDVLAGGDITINADVTASNGVGMVSGGVLETASGVTLQSGADLSLQAASLDLPGVILAGGNVSATATTGNLQLAGDIAAANIELTTLGDLAMTGVLNADGHVLLEADGTVAFDSTAAITTRGTSTDDIVISGASIDLAGAALDAGIAGDISLTANTGGIDDSLGGSVLQGDALALHSAAGIGAMTAIATQVSTLEANALGRVRINELDALSVTSLTTADAVELSTGGNLSVSALSTVGGVSIASGGAVTLASLDTGGGALSISSNGTISDQAGSSINAGITTLDAGGHDIALGDSALDNVNFGTLDVQGGNVNITEDSAMSISRLQATSAVMRASGAITDSTGAQIVVTGQALFDAGSANVTLGDSASDHISVGALGLQAAEASVLADGDLDLAGVNVDRLVAQANGDLTDSGAVVAADANLQATGDLLLDHVANDFGHVEAQAGGSIVLSDINSLVLEHMEAANRIVVTAGGDIDAVSVRSSGGLDSDDVLLEANGSINVTRIQADGEGDIQLVAGAGIIDASGAGTGLIADALSVTAGGSVTADTDVNSLDLVTTRTGDVMITEVDDLALAATLADGSLDVVAGGDLDVSLIRSMNDADINDVHLQAASILVDTLDAGNLGDARLVSGGSIVSSASGSGISADALALDAQGEIHLSTAVNTLEAVSRASGDIVIEENDAIELVDVANAAGKIQVAANGAVLAGKVNTVDDDITLLGGSIEAGQVNAGNGNGNVTLTASSGAIDDVDGDSLIRAATLELNAATGAGNTNALATDVDTLIATSGTGTIAINEMNDLVITRVTNTGGGVDVAAGGDLTAGAITAAANVQLDAVGRLEVDDRLQTDGIATFDAGERIAINAVIDAEGGAIFGATRAGGIDLGANASGAGDIVFHRDVLLATDVLIDSGGEVAFLSGVSGPRSLSVTAGSAQFDTVDLATLTVTAGDALFDGAINVTNAFTLDNSGVATFTSAAPLSAGQFIQAGGMIDLGAGIDSATGVDIGGTLRLADDVEISAVDDVRLRGGVTGRGHDLAIDAAGMRLDAAMWDVGRLTLLNGTHADVNADIGAAAMSFSGVVDLAGGADLIASAGGIDIAGDLILSGASGSSVLQSGADASVTLTSVQGMDSHSLVVRSEGGIVIDTVDIAGDLRLEADIDADQSGLRIKANELNAGDVTLRGGTDRDDRIEVPVIRASGNVVIENRPELVTATRITAMDIALAQGLASADGASLDVVNGGRFTIGGTLSLKDALLQTGRGDVAVNADIITAGKDIRFAGPVQFSGNRRISTGASLTGNIFLTNAVSSSGDVFLEAGDGSIALGNADINGRLALQSAGTLLLSGSVEAGTLDTAALTGAVILDGNAALSANSGIDLGNAAGIDAGGSGGRLAIDAAGDVVLTDVGLLAALDSLDVNGAGVYVQNVVTLDHQRYRGMLNLRGDLVAGGELRAGDVVLQSDALLQGSEIVIDGGIDGLHALRINGDAVNVGGDIGANHFLASLVIDGDRVSLHDVTTSGAQAYTGDVTLDGNLSASTLRFEGALALPGGGALVADTIRFNGGARSVTGAGTLSIVPRSSGRTVTLGEGAGLALDAAALNGYDGGLVIGGFATGIFDELPLVLQPVAGDVVIDAGIDVGEGWITLLGSGDIIMNSGVVSGAGIALVAGGADAEIVNRGDGMLAGGDIILVAGGDIGGERDIRVSGDVLYVSSGAGTAGVSGQVERARHPVLAERIAAAVGINFNPNLQVASSEQRSASREQSGGIADEGFIDPSLFEEIALYEIQGSGIALPADQSEDEYLVPQGDCDIEEQHCGLPLSASPR